MQQPQQKASAAPLDSRRRRRRRRRLTASSTLDEVQIPSGVKFSLWMPKLTHTHTQNTHDSASFFFFCLVLFAACLRCLFACVCLGTHSSQNREQRTENGASERITGIQRSKWKSMIRFRGQRLVAAFGIPISIPLRFFWRNQQIWLCDKCKTWQRSLGRAGRRQEKWGRDAGR